MDVEGELRAIRCRGGPRAVRTFPPVGHRSFRTVVLLAVVSVFNAFDLALTHAQLGTGTFVEANVFAQPFVGAPAGAALYKLALFGAGAVILFRYRRSWQSEAGLWALAVCYAGLMFWWRAYLDLNEYCLSDPAIPPILDLLQ